MLGAEGNVWLVGGWSWRNGVALPRNGAGEGHGVAGQGNDEAGHVLPSELQVLNQTVAETHTHTQAHTHARHGQSHDVIQVRVTFNPHTHSLPEKISYKYVHMFDIFIMCLLKFWRNIYKDRKEKQ